MNQQFINDFHYGLSSDAYLYLGSHLLNDERHTAVFRVYAPRASEVYVLGDFNYWSKANPMTRITSEGIFEAKVENVYLYQNYKYLIVNGDKHILKADPYGYHQETNGSSSTKIYDIESYQWNDQSWQEKRLKTNVYSSPINIYEVHLGSWRKYKDGNCYNYRKMAKELVPYVKKMGFTHIEVMPITEYPYDPSWGYQVTGYFSVTSRFGTPDDFKYFVDYAHQKGIGVIVDWVPAHFPKDDFGLYEFDGAPLYEYDDPLKMEHQEWGTRVFNYQKPEVKSFLTSSAMFFFDKYHIDGIRVDAVASMLYLDYGRTEYRPNCFGGNYNLEAIDFIKGLNAKVFGQYPFALMIAEESTAFPNVTKPTYIDGLGFNYKWNMGWMNDTLSYMKEDPMYRKYHHNKMNFSMMYAYSENFILPLSHDEVVYGKGSLINKMPGNYDQKFANLRAYLGYMYTHPGKKMNFMGYELGQFNEWNYQNELDWCLLQFPKHQQLHLYIQELNKFYLKNAPLWEADLSWEGFSWINADDSDYNLLSYRRIDNKKNELVVVLNFSGNTHHFYRLGVPKGTYKEVFNSDELKYGGDGFLNEPLLETSKYSYNGMKDSLVMRVPAFSVVILKRIKKSTSQKKGK